MKKHLIAVNYIFVYYLFKIGLIHCAEFLEHRGPWVFVPSPRAALNFSDRPILSSIKSYFSYRQMLCRNTAHNFLTELKLQYCLHLLTHLFIQWNFCVPSNLEILRGSSWTYTCSRLKVRWGIIETQSLTYKAMYFNLETLEF